MTLLTDYPPDNYTLDVRTWLANEIYPGLLGETFDARAAAVWVDGSEGFVSLWAGGLGSGQSPEQRLQICKEELYRRIDAVRRQSLPTATPEVRPANRILLGPLRVQGKLFADATGLRRVQFDSKFTALRDYKFDQTRFFSELEDTANAGYQGSRVFLSVGGWSTYWDGHEVAPVRFQKWNYTGNIMRTDSFGPHVEAWPDYEQVFRGVLREYKARGLRLHVTTGDVQIIMPNPEQEVQFHDRMAQIAAEEGGTDVIALWEVTNEYPMNRPGGASPESVEQMGRIIARVRKHLPNVLCAQGACLSDEPADLLDSVKYGDVCATHTGREPFSMCLKHTLGLVFWEGNYRGFPKPYWQGEPKGMNVGPMDGIGDDVYQPSTDPAEMVALYAAHAITGQASNFFDGASVRGTGRDGDAWGYDELPALFGRVFPEDIAAWDHGNDGRGGIMYWFKGKSFVAPTWREWRNDPPMPIAEWTLYTGTAIKSGTGVPPAGTGLLVGRFS